MNSTALRAEVQIGIAKGVDISFLSKEQQQYVLAILEETGATMNASQSAKLKEYGKSGCGNRGCCGRYCRGCYHQETQSVKIDRHQERRILVMSKIHEKIMKADFL